MGGACQVILGSHTSHRGRKQPVRGNASRNVVRNRRANSAAGTPQTHLLEVKARWRAVARHRAWAASRVAIWVLFFAGIIGGIAYGGRRALDIVFFENPRYTIREIRVEADGTLTRDQVLNLARIREGRNLFTVDLDKARESLEEISQIQRVQVERVLPDKVIIRVQERKPVAWIAPQGQEEDPYSILHSYLVDARGILLRVDEQLPEYMHLPVILGVHPSALHVGEPVVLPEVRAALDLLRLNALGPLQTRFLIQSINVSREYCLVVTDQKKSLITFALEDLDGQIERFKRLLDYSDSTGQEIATINLIPRRNIPVTFLAVAAPEELVPLEKPDEKPASRQNSSSGGNTRKTAPPVPVRRALPVRPAEGAARNG